VAELKNTYTSREVAAMTGLTARQLQWWDAHRLFASHIAAKKTARGGYTERRYTPVDLLELLVLAELRRQGVSVAQLRRLLDTLREQFGVRLFETIGGGGPLTLLSDGHDVYGRTANGDLFNMLRDPQQPLLMLADVEGLRELGAARPGSRRKKPALVSRASRQRPAARSRPAAATPQRSAAADEHATDEHATDKRQSTQKRNS
jgi:DNA-binding transcriptional MerR regulator